MDRYTLKSLLQLLFTKELILSLEDGLKAEALKAHHVIRDHTGLKAPQRAKGAEGQIRWRMMEERFEEILKLNGGKILDGGVMPASNLQIFQPFLRFEIEEQGLICGLATMSEPKVLPSKNKSRVAGVSANCHLLPSLFAEHGPKVGDVFVLLLICRDRERAGLIEEIAVGVIDSKYKSFLLYEPIESFIGEADLASPAPPPDPAPVGPTLALKKRITPFIPPEVPPAERKDTGTE
jgi:hypothetical protein